MKKIFLIIASIFITLLSNPILAQEDPGADPDVPTAPIDNYVLVLALLGLVFVFLKVRAIVRADSQKY